MSKPTDFPTPGSISTVQLLDVPGISLSIVYSGPTQGGLLAKELYEIVAANRRRAAPDDSSPNTDLDADGVKAMLNFTRQTCKNFVVAIHGIRGFQRDDSDGIVRIINEHLTLAQLVNLTRQIIDYQLPTLADFVE